MTENDKNLIVSLWENGEPISHIIKMLPYSTETARQMIVDLRKNNVLKLENRSNRAGGWRIVKMYNDGITNPYEIAEKLNYSINTVQIVLSKAKLGRERPKHNYKKTRTLTYDELCDNSRKIIDLLKIGKDCTEIARMLGCTRQNVFIIKKKFFPERVRNNKGDSI